MLFSVNHRTKPGKDKYTCTKCGQVVILDDHTDTLPLCPKCNGTNYRPCAYITSFVIAIIVYAGKGRASLVLTVIIHELTFSGLCPGRAGSGVAKILLNSLPEETSEKNAKPGVQ